jgi:hypothetical protein
MKIGTSLTPTLAPASNKHENINILTGNVKYYNTMTTSRENLYHILMLNNIFIPVRVIEYDKKLRKK